jgi:hypothetical protein
MERVDEYQDLQRRAAIWRGGRDRELTSDKTYTLRLSPVEYDSLRNVLTQDFLWNCVEPDYPTAKRSKDLLRVLELPVEGTHLKLGEYDDEPEDPAWLEEMAEKYGITVEEFRAELEERKRGKGAEERQAQRDADFAQLKALVEREHAGRPK